VATETPIAEQARSDPKEQQPRVNVFGRVGALPRFRTTPNGRLIASFPLAVREAEDKTTWHAIVVFDERAEKLREALAKGMAVKGECLPLPAPLGGARCLPNTSGVRWVWPRGGQELQAEGGGSQGRKATVRRLSVGEG